MLNTAFYANWSTFWGGPRVGGKYNGPLTFAPFIGGVDRVIYGYLMFGIKPNPHLQLITTPGLFQGCKYVPMGTDEVPYVDSGDFDTYGMYPNYCWTGMAGNEWIQHDYRIDDDETFGQFAELKTLKSGLAVIASYGGWTWTHGGAQFSDLSGAKFHEMVTSQANIEAFVSSSLAYLKAKGFDGVDFDWEYPGQPTAASISPADAANDFIGFQNLITEYRKQAGSDFIITMQCSGFLSGDISIESLPGYPGKSMRNDSDYFTWIGSLIEAGLTNVNIMAYDYYTATSTPLATRPNAPIGCTGPTSIDSSNVAYKSLSGSERLGAETPTLDASYSLVSTQEVNNSDWSYKNDQLVGFSGGEQDSTCPVHYIVKPVDTFESLAAQFGVTEEVLLAYNGFTAQTVIQAGETILQPPKPPAPACPNVDSTNLQVTGITDKTATDLANFFKIGAGEANIKILASMNPKAATDPSWPKLSQSTKYNMCGVSYTLTGSDNIQSVALAHGVSWMDLCGYNNLSGDDCTRISAGKTLIVPAAGWTNCGLGPTPPAPIACGATHKVLANETLLTIATTLGIKAETLATYNGLASTTTPIQEDEVLMLPPTTGPCPSIPSTDLQIVGIAGKTATDLANFFKIGAGTADIDVLTKLNPGATGWPNLTAGTKYNVCGATYTTVDGDTSHDIAIAHAVATEDLCGYNNLSGAQCALPKGTKLVLPSSGWSAGCGTPPPPPPSSNCGKTHVVVQNDSAASIAKEAGVTTDVFCAYNGLSMTECQGIDIGETLLLPPTSGTCPSIPSTDLQITGIAGKTATDLANFFKVGNGVPEVDILEQLNPGAAGWPNLNAGQKYNVCAAKYTVVDNDNMSKIAAAFGANSSTDLCGYNGLADTACANVEVGQIIIVPSKGWSASCGAPPPPPPAPAGSCGKTHVVVNNDTSSNIAQKAGVPLATFCAYNGFSMADCGGISIGETLLLPPTSGTCPSIASTDLKVTGVAGKTATDLANFFKVGNGSADVDILTKLNPSAPGWPNLTAGTKYNVCAASYTIASGDNMNNIALAHGASNPNDLCAYNGISTADCGNVQAGTVIIVPSKGWSTSCGSVPPPPPPTPTGNCGKTHLITSTDNLQDLAKTYNVTPASLCVYNGLSNDPTTCSNQINVGETIIIPPTSGTCPSIASDTLKITGIKNKTALDLANFFKIGLGSPDTSVLNTLNSSITGWPVLSDGVTYSVCAASYTIAASDKSWQSIAYAHGVDTADLCGYNNISSADCSNTPVAGKVIIVPSAGWSSGCATPPPPPDNCGQTHLFTATDTLSYVAQMYQVDTTSLCTYNGYATSDACNAGIKAGDTILIPPIASAGPCKSIASTAVPITGITGKTATDLANFFKIGAGKADTTALDSLNSTIAGWPNLVSGTRYHVCATIYTLTANDTMSSIAQAHDVDLADLCSYNGFAGSSCNNIQSGYPIVVPSAGWSNNCAPPPPVQKTLDYCISKTLSNINDVIPQYANKFILGLACYGRSFAGVTELALMNPDERINNSVFLSSTGPAPAGDYTSQDGVLSYFEIVERKSSAGPFSMNDYDLFESDYNSINSSLATSLNAIAANNYAGLTGPYNVLKTPISAALAIMDNLDDPHINSKGFAGFDYTASARFAGGNFDNVTTVLEEGGNLVSNVQKMNILLANAYAGYNALCTVSPSTDPKDECTSEGLSIVSKWQVLVNSPGSTTTPSLSSLTSDLIDSLYKISTSLVSQGEDTDDGCVDLYAPDYTKIVDPDVLTNMLSILTSVQTDLVTINTLSLPTADMLTDVEIMVSLLSESHSNNLIDATKNFVTSLSGLNYFTAFTQTASTIVNFVLFLTSMNDAVYQYFASCPASASTDEGNAGTCPLKDSFDALGALLAPSQDPKKPGLSDVLIQGNVFIETVMTVPAVIPGTKNGEVGFACNTGLTLGYNDSFGTSIGYSVQDATWVSFDAPDSLAKKIALANKNGLGGVMSFTPQQDNWAGGYPMMTAINTAIQSGTPQQDNWAGGYPMMAAINTAVQSGVNIELGETINTPIAGCDLTYTVQENDTISSIAHKHKLTSKNILKCNPKLHITNLEDCDQIQLPTEKKAKDRKLK